MIPHDTLDNPSPQEWMEGILQQVLPSWFISLVRNPRTRWLANRLVWMVPYYTESQNRPDGVWYGVYKGKLGKGTLIAEAHYVRWVPKENVG